MVLGCDMTSRLIGSSFSDNSFCSVRAKVQCCRSRDQLVAGSQTVHSWGFWSTAVVTSVLTKEGRVLHLWRCVFGVLYSTNKKGISKFDLRLSTEEKILQRLKKVFFFYLTGPFFLFLFGIYFLWRHLIFWAKKGKKTKAERKLSTLST